MYSLTYLPALTDHISRHSRYTFLTGFTLNFVSSPGAGLGAVTARFEPAIMRSVDWQKDASVVDSRSDDVWWQTNWPVFIIYETPCGWASVRSTGPVISS